MNCIFLPSLSPSFKLISMRKFNMHSTRLYVESRFILVISQGFHDHTTALVFLKQPQWVFSELVWGWWTFSALRSQDTYNFFPFSLHLFCIFMINIHPPLKRNTSQAANKEKYSQKPAASAEWLISNFILLFCSWPSGSVTKIKYGYSHSFKKAIDHI